MYSTAVERMVALLSFFTGDRRSKSSGESSLHELSLSRTRKVGMLSRSAAILWFKFVRYRFSIILCVVLCGEMCPLLSRVDESNSELSDDLRFWDLRVSSGSGEGDNGGVIGRGCMGMAILSSLDSSSELSGAKGRGLPIRSQGRKVEQRRSRGGMSLVSGKLGGLWNSGSSFI